MEPIWGGGVLVLENAFPLASWLADRLAGIEGSKTKPAAVSTDTSHPLKSVTTVISL